MIVVGPVAVAVALLRSSSDAQGPSLAAQLFIATLTLGLAAPLGLIAYRAARLILRLLERRSGE